jgi:hypothetical protein
VVGAKFPITTVPGSAVRYLRLYYTVTGSAPSTGRIIAGCGVEVIHQNTTIYPDSLRGENADGNPD